MPDINLLGVAPQKQYNPSHIASWIARFLLFALIVLALYYIYLFWQASQVNGQLADVATKTAQAQSAALATKDRPEVITRQGQIQNLDKLIKQHPYWSGLLPELARVTLKSASYASITADDAGSLTLDVVAPDYSDLDKYLQVFDLPEYNKQFSDVTVQSITKSQQGDKVQVDMKILLKFNPDIIHKTATNG